MKTRARSNTARRTSRRRPASATPPPASERRPILETFIDSLRAALLQGAHENGLTTEEGHRTSLDAFRRAIPVARAVALLGNPMDPTAEPIERLAQELAKDYTSGDDSDAMREASKTNAVTDAQYFTALALGLLLAEQIGGQR